MPKKQSDFKDWGKPASTRRRGNMDRVRATEGADGTTQKKRTQAVEDRAKARHNDWKKTWSF